MIKRHLFLVVMVLNISMMAHAMELDTKVKLPPACQLKKNFEQGGIGGFAHQTKIHEFLDGKEMSLGLIFNAADTYRAQYLEKMYKSNPNLRGMQPDDLLKKEKILQCILHRVSVVEKIDHVQHMNPLIKTMHTQICLPKQRDIKESLSGFEMFVKMTKIHKRLGFFSQLSPIKITEIVDACIKDYDCRPLEWISNEERQEILQIILRNSPEIYRKLCQYEVRQQSKL